METKGNREIKGNRGTKKYLTHFLHCYLSIFALLIALMSTLFLNAPVAQAAAQQAQQNRYYSEDTTMPPGSPATRFEVTWRILQRVKFVGVGIAVGLGVNIPNNNPKAAQVFWILQATDRYSSGMTGGIGVTASKDSDRTVADEVVITGLNFQDGTHRLGDYIVYPGPTPTGPATHYHFKGEGKVLTPDEIPGFHVPAWAKPGFVWLNDDSLGTDPNLQPFELQAVAGGSSDTSTLPAPMSVSNLLAAYTLFLPATTLPLMGKFLAAAQLAFQLAHGRVENDQSQGLPDQGEIVQENLDFSKALAANPLSSQEQMQLSGLAMAAVATALVGPAFAEFISSLASSAGDNIANILQSLLEPFQGLEIEQGLKRFFQLSQIQPFDFQTGELIPPDASTNIATGNGGDTASTCTTTSGDASCDTQNSQTCPDTQDTSSQCTAAAPPDNNSSTPTSDNTSNG